mmetsp:Transcript_13964/g.21119  ORF Transcript_13964/g.21119 Transcript_13964/m.21119 type:complete len:827 (+) Transcript_13964:133-2613(+)|eukprot:CAMPEP_0167747766 /NCGR_PEP_ID=MMETSP0110_2-20121227/4462_1 /TAXON_ID=629695 /ORGANISM="Gymnochlora sp., Strain CCMP2014" /LENGTH=826 /DNA_ID=CAMNT_0007632701 /DNA_START=46 /DNA_END=2526 /DNA_ORIENTATION=-
MRGKSGSNRGRGRTRAVIAARLRRRRESVQKNCQGIVNDLQNVIEENKLEKFLDPAPELREAFQEAVKSPLRFRDVVKRLQLRRFDSEDSLFSALRTCFENMLVFYKSKTKAHAAGEKLWKFLESKLAQLPEDIRPKPVPIPSLVQRKLFIRANAKSRQWRNYSPPVEIQKLAARTSKPNKLVSSIAWRILSSLKNETPIEDFIEPVDYIQMNIPGYPEVIKYPLALEDIRQRLCREAYSTLEEFIDDVCLVFENAVTFNLRSTRVYANAHLSWEVLRRHVADLSDAIRPVVPESLEGIRRRLFFYIRANEPSVTIERSRIRKLAKRPMREFKARTVSEEDIAVAEKFSGKVVQLKQVEEKSEEKETKYWIVKKIDYSTLVCELQRLEKVGFFPKESKFYDFKRWQISPTSKRLAPDVKDLKIVPSIRVDGSIDLGELDSWILIEDNKRPRRANTTKSGIKPYNFWYSKKVWTKNPGMWRCGTCGIENANYRRTCIRCWSKSPKDWTKVSHASEVSPNISSKEEKPSRKRKPRQLLRDFATNSSGSHGRRSSTQTVEVSQPMVKRQRKARTPRGEGKKRGRGVGRRKEVREIQPVDMSLRDPSKLEEGDKLRVTWSDEGTFDCHLFKVDIQWFVRSTNGLFNGSVPFDPIIDEWEKIPKKRKRGRPKMSEREKQMRQKGTPRAKQKKMTFKEKERLFNEIHELPPEKLEDVVAIIDKHKEKAVKVGNEGETEVEIDIATLSDLCLKELKMFVRNTKTKGITPTVGMRARVWFSNPPAWYEGIIRGCRKRRNLNLWDITVHYDDGETENVVYPDPKGEVMLNALDRL